jgi:hypothetical protein
MNEQRELGEYGRGFSLWGLGLVVLLVIAAFLITRTENVQAENDSLRVGQSVTGWIPQGDMNRWYKLRSSAQTLVTITATRTDGDLAPQLTLLYHDGNEYRVAAYDGNYGAADTARLSAMLPVTAVDYWIEVASAGATSGVFTLKMSRGNTWQREEETYNGYKVTFTIDKIVCGDTQDGDGVDELELEYLMSQNTPYGAAVEVNKNKVDDMWMQSGWEFSTFSPLARQVGNDDSVSLTIKLKEEDAGLNDDEMLAQGTNTLSPQQLKHMADSGKAASIYWPVGNGQYQYGITYSIFVEKI